MGYSVETVVDFFWRQARLQGESLDVLKIHRLVYIATCWAWAVFNRPLLDESLGATKYGPVVPSLLVQLKSLGAGFLLEPIGSTEALRRSLDEETERFLNCIWVKYGGYSGIQLTRLIHEDRESPWRQARLRSHVTPLPVIQPRSMRDRYLKLVAVSQAAHRA